MSTSSPIGFFERYLSLWVALCIATGIALGSVFPGLFQPLATLEYGSVSFIVAVLIWLMVYPMRVSVDFSSLKRIHQRPKGLIITLVVYWLIKPFTMAGLGVLFFHYFFVDLIDPANASQYRAGLILLGAALVTVVGVLVEVPAMLSLVAFANRTQGSLARTVAERPGWHAYRNLCTPDGCGIGGKA